MTARKGDNIIGLSTPLAVTFAFADDARQALGDGPQLRTSPEMRAIHMTLLLISR